MMNEINKVLNTFDHDWEPSPKGKQEWLQAYFTKQEIKNLNLMEQLKKLKEFYNSDLSEKSFRDIFKNDISTTSKYISPLSYHKQLKEIEIKKIAFNLSNLINLEYNKSFSLCQRLYCLYNSDKWNYQTFMILLNDYDSQLKIKLLLKENIAA